jgi:hypothetical protein
MTNPRISLDNFALRARSDARWPWPTPPSGCAALDREPATKEHAGDAHVSIDHRFEVTFCP